MKKVLIVALLAFVGFSAFFVAHAQISNPPPQLWIPTLTYTPTVLTSTPTLTATNATSTPTATFTNTRTSTHTYTVTPTYTSTHTYTHTNTWNATTSATIDATNATGTFTFTPTLTPTVLTNTPTLTPTVLTNTPTHTNTNGTGTPTLTFTPTYTSTPTYTATRYSTAIIQKLLPKGVMVLELTTAGMGQLQDPAAVGEYHLWAYQNSIYRRPLRRDVSLESLVLIAKGAQTITYHGHTYVLTARQILVARAQRGYSQKAHGTTRANQTRGGISSAIEFVVSLPTITHTPTMTGTLPTSTFTPNATNTITPTPTWTFTQTFTPNLTNTLTPTPTPTFTPTHTNTPTPVN